MTRELFFKLHVCNFLLIFFRLVLLIVSLALIVQFHFQVGFKSELLREFLLMGLLSILFSEGPYCLVLVFILWFGIAFPLYVHKYIIIYGTIENLCIHYLKSALLVLGNGFIGFWFLFFLDLPNDQYLPFSFLFCSHYFSSCYCYGENVFIPNN